MFRARALVPGCKEFQVGSYKSRVDGELLHEHCIYQPPQAVPVSGSARSKSILLRHGKFFRGFNTKECISWRILQGLEVLFERHCAVVLVVKHILNRPTRCRVPTVHPVENATTLAFRCAHQTSKAR